MNCNPDITTFTDFDGPGEPPNAYLFSQKPVTLIDAGIVGGENRRILEGALAGKGLEVSDIEQVILTHWHWDHTGLATWIADNSDAVFFTHKAEVFRICAGAEESATFLSALKGYYDRNGIDRSISGAIVSLAFEHGRPELPRSRVRSLRDGELIPTSAGPLTVVHTPGHTPGSICLFEKSEGVVFSSDNLYGMLFPHPVAEIPDPEHTERSSLVEYPASLEKIMGLGARLCMPGHGAPFTDIERTGNAVKRFIERRLARVERLLASGPMTAGEILTALFPKVGDTTLLYSVAEVMLLCETLELKGKARRENHAGLVKFSIVS